MQGSRSKRYRRRPAHVPARRGKRRVKRPDARRWAEARAVKGAKRRRGPLTGRSNAQPSWSARDVGPHGSDVPQLEPGVVGMTVEDLVAALGEMPASYPVSAGICPDSRYVEEDLAIYESWNFVVNEVRLVGGEVVLA